MVEPISESSDHDSKNTTKGLELKSEEKSTEGT